MLTDKHAQHVCVVAEILDESRGDIPVSRFFIAGIDEQLNDPDLAWAVGWLEGAAHAANLLPEQLIEQAREIQRRRVL